MDAKGDARSESDDHETRIGPSVTVGPCAPILLETLRSQPGVRALTIDPKTGELTLRYDSERISLKRIEALAGRVAERLDRNRDECRVRREGIPCDECPDFTGSGDDRRQGVRWLGGGASGKRLGVELRAGGGRFAELTVSTRRLGRVREPISAWTGRLEVLPVFVCGFLLVLGWFLWWLDLPGHEWAYLGATLAGGAPTLWSTVRSLAALKLDVDLLMLVAALGATLIGHFEEAAVLMFLFSLSTLLESYAMGRTRRAIESLLALRPDEATVLRNGEPIRVSVEDVEVGERIVVKPGERVPLDGRIRDGAADVDESALTGESLPQWKEAGAPLLAGSINLSGSLVVETTTGAGASTLSRIVDLVEQAHGSRTPTERIFDRFTKYYILLIVLAATTTALGPPALGLAPWSDMFHRAMTLLVVASPCALVISTPATILSAIAAAARHGILFKGGAAVEVLGQANIVAFDKTGTLTDGALAVAGVDAIDDPTGAMVLALAAAAERSSEHPLARAIVDEATRREIDVPTAESFRTTAGLGVEAIIDGRTVLVGSLRFLERLGVPDTSDATRNRFPEVSGKSVWVAHQGELLGRIILADTLRAEAPLVIDRLKGLGIERVTMLTGDERQVADHIASQAGIDDVHAALLPEEKVDRLGRLRTAGATTVMVGDGINDAPAMAVADVGVAMGAAGTDLALETADVVLVSSNLEKLIEAIELARRSRRILFQNLSLASAVIACLVVFALVGALPLTVGVVGHEGSTLLVVLNGIRLLAWKPTAAKARPESEARRRVE